MPTIIYSVVATLPTPEMLDEYVAWLEDGHVQAVVDGGADSGEIIILDDEDPRVESRYAFPDRKAFRHYEDHVAPPLRADGRAKFGDRGVSFTRRTGTLKAAFK